MQINCSISSTINLNPNDLPLDVKNKVLSRLRVPNPQKKMAVREMLRNANKIPEFIDLWKYNGHHELVLPRGFVFEFEKILNDNDIYVKYKNETIKDYSCSAQKNINPIDLRDYQDEAVSELFSYGSGVYKSPTGSGKTRTMLELIRCCGQRTLVICEKLDIASQWEDIAINFGFEIGKELLICLRQTILAANYGPIWFDEFGCVVLDEQHHASSETNFELLGRFPAYYRFGCSATPDSDEDLFPISRAVIGPVVHSTLVEEIGEHLVIPSVRVIKTEFEFPYRPTERLQNGRVLRNNYNDMMAALEKNRARNELIIDCVLEECWGGSNIGKCLIVSKRKEHLKELTKIFIEKCPTIFNGPIQFLTGDNSSQAQKISYRIDKQIGFEGSVLFSTLAEEGTDIPRLDRLFLAYPGRKLRGFEQSIGRIMRPHPQKKDAIVYDFRDYKVPLLNSQFRDRSQRIYSKREYKIDA